MDSAPRALFWHTGRDLGADVLGRLGVPGPGPVGPDTALPPALVEHAVRRGDTNGVVGPYHVRKWSRNGPGDPDLLLRLLERDDPEVNAVLFARSDWPALRQAILAQQRFAPRPPDAPDLLPLAAGLRDRIFAEGARDDLQAALSAADPDLLFWALASGAVGAAYGGDLTRAHAAWRLGAVHNRRAQVRHILDTVPVRIPHGLPPGTAEEIVHGRSRPGTLDQAVTQEARPETLFDRLSLAKRTAHGRGLLRNVLHPGWQTLHMRHLAAPLPWGAAVALVEHPRCPDAFRAALLDTHPRAVQFVGDPGPDVLAHCTAVDEDTLTKTVLLRGLAAGSLAPEHLLTTARPARLALTALVHGGVEAVAAQAHAIRLIRPLLLRHVAHPGGWRHLYAALPEFTGSATALLAAEPLSADADAKRPGRQAAWAYATLIGIAGPEHTTAALEFLSDEHLAPVAGARELPQDVADHALAHGGPLTHRVLAANPDLRQDLLTPLVLSGDREIASTAYRNPRCPFALRQYILSIDGITDDLRTELRQARDLDIWPLLASPDLGLLRHAAAATGRTAWIRQLRAAARIAETHGLAALDGLPGDAVAAARETGTAAPIAEALAEHRHTTEKLLSDPDFGYTAQGLTHDHVYGDPGLDWSDVLAQVRSGSIANYVVHSLAQRPDFPLELGRLHRDAADRSEGRRAVHGAALAWHRPLVAEVLRDAPLVWDNAFTALKSGAITADEFTAVSDAAQTVDAAAHHPPLARAVARLLGDALGDTADAVDAWTILARMLADRPAATLTELAATARAAA